MKGHHPHHPLRADQDVTPRLIRTKVGNVHGLVQCSLSGARNGLALPGFATSVPSSRLAFQGTSANLQACQAKLATK